MLTCRTARSRWMWRRLRWRETIMRKRRRVPQRCRGRQHWFAGSLTKLLRASINHKQTTRAAMPLGTLASENRR
jgi:hypothetical protein